MNLKSIIYFIVALVGLRGACLFPVTCLANGPPTQATSVLSAGGGRIVNAEISIDSSLGGWGGISGAAQNLLKQGFIGQLHDLKGTLLDAVTPSVDELTSTQLSLTAEWDDDTFTPIGGGEVSWSVVSGPIVSITESGEATAGFVYQTTAGAIRASYHGTVATFELAVLDTHADNFGIYANDGLPDTWQVQYFGESNLNAGPAIDFDGDGLYNSQEYAVGTDPKDSTSSLRITSIEEDAGDIRLSFTPVLGRTYRIERNEDFPTGLWVSVAEGLTGTGGVLQFIDSGTANFSKLAYRVVLRD